MPRESEAFLVWILAPRLDTKYANFHTPPPQPWYCCCFHCEPRESEAFSFWIRVPHLVSSYTLQTTSRLKQAPCPCVVCYSHDHRQGRRHPQHGSLRLSPYTMHSPARKGPPVPIYWHRRHSNGAEWVYGDMSSCYCMHSDDPYSHLSFKARIGPIAQTLEE